MKLYGIVTLQKPSGLVTLKLNRGTPVVLLKVGGAVMFKVVSLVIDTV
jgi:hypothetical protein